MGSQIQEGGYVQGEFFKVDEGIAKLLAERVQFGQMDYEEAEAYLSSLGYASGALNTAILEFEQLEREDD